MAFPTLPRCHCEENEGRLDIRTDAGGGQYGVCVFPDGSECDEWAFFRGECTPRSAEQTQPVGQQPAGGWQLYQDSALGYSFEYPPDCLVEEVEGSPGSLAVSGSSPDNEFWPQFMINAPADRQDFNPPEDAILEEWLASHNLMPDDRQADTSIAGTTAIHLRHERSPQSYAFDRYYLAHAGQLYEIVIGHVGDHEDWELYNRFLESFTFLE